MVESPAQKVWKSVGSWSFLLSWILLNKYVKTRTSKLFWAELIGSGFLAASSCFDISKDFAHLGTKHFKHLILGWQDRGSFPTTKPKKDEDMPKLQLIQRCKKENAQSLISSLGVSHHRQQRLRFLLPGKTSSYGTGKGAPRVEGKLCIPANYVMLNHKSSKYGSQAGSSQVGPKQAMPEPNSCSFSDLLLKSKGMCICNHVGTDAKKSINV